MTPSTPPAAAGEPRIGAEAARRARRVKMVLLDVDGVLTDGRIVFTGDGLEAKLFSSQDGVGVRLAQRTGLKFGIITGRKSPALEMRARELGITEVHQRALKKAEPYAKLLAASKLQDSEIAYVGDDLVDLPVMKKAGFAATVPEARPEVLRAAHFVSGRGCGHGAVREILDFIMRVQGTWRRATRDLI